MSELGVLWKHQSNPACTRSVKSLQNVEDGHYKEEEEEEVEEEDTHQGSRFIVSSGGQKIPNRNDG